MYGLDEIVSMNGNEQPRRDDGERVKWTDLVPVLAIAVTQAPTPEERAGAMKELMHMASILDRHIDNLQTLQEEEKPKGNIICPDCGVRGGHAYGCPLASAIGGIVRVNPSADANGHCPECGRSDEV